MKTIVVINQKGGVGKTTTADCLSSGLVLKGYQVLAIDSDPQGNLSSAFGFGNESPKSLENVYIDNFPLLDVIVKKRGVDVIPCSLSLASADRRMVQYNSHKILKRKLQDIDQLYDYCIIDAPPSLGILSLNALVSADYLIIPLNASVFSIQGLRCLFDVIQEVKSDNKALSILGLLLTRFNSRTRIGKDSINVLNEISKEMQTSLFDIKIRQGISVEIAQLEHKSLYDRFPTELVTCDYMAFVEEVIRKMDR